MARGRTSSSSSSSSSFAAAETGLSTWARAENDTDRRVIVPLLLGPPSGTVRVGRTGGVLVCVSILGRPARAAGVDEGGKGSVDDRTEVDLNGGEDRRLRIGLVMATATGGSAGGASTTRGCVRSRTRSVGLVLPEAIVGSNVDDALGDLEVIVLNTRPLSTSTARLRMASENSSVDRGGKEDRFCRGRTTSKLNVRSGT